MDIEGAEFLVLQTIPWDKVDIEVGTHQSSYFQLSRKIQMKILIQFDPPGPAHPPVQCLSYHNGSHIYVEPVR